MYVRFFNYIDISFLIIDYLNIRTFVLFPNNILQAEINLWMYHGSFEFENLCLYSMILSSVHQGILSHNNLPVLKMSLSVPFFILNLFFVT